MTRNEKPLSDEALGYKVSAENWRESYFKLMDKYAEAVEKLKEELIPDFLAYGYKDYEKEGNGLSTMEICHREDCNSFVMKRIHKEIDKIMGSFDNHSPQDICDKGGAHTFTEASTEDTHAKDGWGHQKRYKEKKGCGTYLGNGKYCGKKLNLCPECDDELRMQLQREAM